MFVPACQTNEDDEDKGRFRAGRVESCSHRRRAASSLLTIVCISRLQGHAIGSFPSELELQWSLLNVSAAEKMTSLEATYGRQ